jgi:hypothetical protein
LRQRKAAPAAEGVRSWSDLVPTVFGKGADKLSVRFGKSESTVQRAWKAYRYGSTERTNGQSWLDACDSVAKLSDKVDPGRMIRDHSAYVRTRITGYVMWAQARSEGRVKAHGRITDAVRTTGAAGTKSQSKATRDASVKGAAHTVAVAFTAKGASKSKADATPLMLAGSATLVTAGDIAGMSDAQLRELAAVIAAELERRKATADAATVLAAKAASENTKGAVKQAA